MGILKDFLKLFQPEIYSCESCYLKDFVCFCWADFHGFKMSLLCNIIMNTDSKI